MKRSKWFLKWLAWLSGTFVTVFLALWGFLDPLGGFGLERWLQNAGLNGYVVLLFASYVVASLVATYKSRKEQGPSEREQLIQNLSQEKQQLEAKIKFLTSRRAEPGMLRYELEPIPPEVKSVCALIFGFPDIADFIRSSEFARLCEHHNVEKLWQSTEKALLEKSHEGKQSIFQNLLPSLTDTFYNFMNRLFKKDKILFSNFKEEFLKKYKEAYVVDNPSRNEELRRLLK